MKKLLFFVLASLALAACHAKSSAPVAAADAPEAQSAEDTWDGECFTADSYADLVSMSYLQYKVSEGGLEVLQVGRTKVLQDVQSMYTGRILMYQPELPEGTEDAVNTALAEFQIAIDAHMDTIRSDVEAQLSRAEGWKAQSVAQMGALSALEVAAVRESCYAVEAEVEALSSGLGDAFGQALEPVGDVIATYNLRGDGLEQSAWMDPLGLPDFGTPPPPLRPLDESPDVDRETTF